MHSQPLGIINAYARGTTIGKHNWQERVPDSTALRKSRIGIRAKCRKVPNRLAEKAPPLSLRQDRGGVQERGDVAFGEL